jgi:hypothetical protein
MVFKGKNSHCHPSLQPQRAENVVPSYGEHRC